MRRGSTETLYDFLVAIRNFPKMGTIQKMVVANINYGVGYQLVKKLKEKDLITYERPRKRILNLRLTKEGSELVSSMTPIIKLCEEVLRKDTDKEN